jgi:carbonic anhydrase
MRRWIGGAVIVAALGGGLLYTEPGREVQFLLGGAMVNAGFRMQDHLESFDFAHHEDISPDQVWQEMVEQNAMASRVRQTFPRTPRHPLVAIVACMDARIDTSELTGDTRKYYYIVRTAGSVLEEKEEEMLELAVENGVKVVVLTTHSDCAAERAAKDAAMRQRLPALTQAVDERDRRVRELLERPNIKSRIAAGTLLVKMVNIDTMTEQILPAGSTPAPAAPTPH